MSKKGVKGERALLRNLDKIRKSYPEAVGVALYQNGIDIMKASTPLVPWEHGILKGSWIVDAPKMIKGEPTVRLGYGTHYALYQHERTELNHPRGGEAKFLEKALDSERSGFTGKLARRAKKALAKGQGLLIVDNPKPETGDEYKQGDVV